MRLRVSALLTPFGWVALAASGRPALPPSSRVISAIRSPSIACWCWYPTRAACNNSASGRFVYAIESIILRLAVASEGRSSKYPRKNYFTFRGAIV